jgi:hypothetical protein
LNELWTLSSGVPGLVRVELLEEKENEQKVDGTRNLSRLGCLGRKFALVLSREDQIMREDLIKREREWSRPRRDNSRYCMTPKVSCKERQLCWEVARAESMIGRVGELS